MGTQLVNGRLEQYWELAKDRPGQEAETAAQETQCYVKSIHFNVVILIYFCYKGKAIANWKKKPVGFFYYRLSGKNIKGHIRYGFDIISD